VMTSQSMTVLRDSKVSNLIFAIFSTEW
jgi:hypothetical protein